VAGLQSSLDLVKVHTLLAGTELRTHLVHPVDRDGRQGGNRAQGGQQGGRMSGNVLASPQATRWATAQWAAESRQ
jgi:hypothetical protein